MYKKGRILLLGYLHGIALCSTKIRYFFDNFIRFFSKTSARISQSLWSCSYEERFRLSSKTLFQFFENVAKTRFWLLLATTGQNHMLFSAIETFYSILTENKQAKPGSFQIRSLKIVSSCTFYTFGTVPKYVFSPRNFYLFVLGGSGLFKQYSRKL